MHIQDQPRYYHQKRRLQVWRRKGLGESIDQKRGKEIWRKKGVTESSEQGRMRNVGNRVTTQHKAPHTINVQSSGNG